MTVVYPRKFQNTLSARDVMKNVVRDRDIHLITLNRYRYSEQRSCKDLTVVIELLNGEPAELVKDLSNHIAEESRHALWLTELLVDLGGSVGTPPGTLYIEEFERLLDKDGRRADETIDEFVIESLAAINVTEKRGCEYFAAHIHALKEAPQTEETIKVREVIERILPEEAGHVRWGNRWLAEMARKSEANRQKVEQVKRKYAAIEQAAFESGMDITLGAELRRVGKVLDIANTLPIWERPNYLMEQLPNALLSVDLQRTRIDVAQRAWNRDPQAFIERFIPMFINGVNRASVNQAQTSKASA